MRLRCTFTSLPRLFSELPPSYQASLGRKAHEGIRDEISTAQARFWGFEVGGWMFSDPRRHDHILVATRPGADAESSPSSIFLGSEMREVIENIAPHLSLRGCWHLHPDGDSLPSTTDRRGWMRGCEITSDYWVAIIATPARSMWDQPELHGWITTSAYCEPLALEEL